MFAKLLTALVTVAAVSSVFAAPQPEGLVARQHEGCKPCMLSIDMGSLGSIPNYPDSCPEGTKCYGINYNNGSVTSNIATVTYGMGVSETQFIERWFSHIVPSYSLAWRKRRLVGRW